MLTAALLITASVIGASIVNGMAGLRPGPDEYNIGAWEVRNVPGKWLFLAGELIRGSPSEEDQDATLRRFFDLVTEIDDLERQLSDAGLRVEPLNEGLSAKLAALRAERDSIENQVESTLEHRLSTVIADAGITRDLLFDVVWPPVDTEFTAAPRALARSPRDRIELLGSDLLREDLTLAEAERIEARVSAEQDVAALSFSTAGIGAYPTIVDYPSNYRRALEVIAHEWMHNYLFFRPLGYNYYANNDLRTINETVADLVGRELADAAMERWPLADPEPVQTPANAVPQPGIDLRAELVALRGEVDELLADGRIDQAEALMESRRQELVDQGYYIRKINQAYFAYLNLYAGEDGSAAATNPIGPKVDELRKGSESLQAFVDIVGSVTSVEELDEALAELQ